MSSADASGFVPDPYHSQVVLIGVGTYEWLPDLPAVHNNLGGLAAALRDPGVWGVPDDRCLVVSDPHVASVLIDRLEDVRAQAEDALVVYYAGHGLTDTRGDLYLSTTESRQGRVDTQVNYDWIREAVRNSPARRRIVILDCCYSGRAINQPMGGDTDYTAQTDIDGSFVLTATPENRQAVAPKDQPYTAFTSELIALLQTGLAGEPELITLKQIYNGLRNHLTSKALPKPQAWDRNDVGGQTCFRNRAHKGQVALADAPERRAAARRINVVCLPASRAVLRAESLPVHERVYVRRPIDDDVAARLKAFTQSQLRRMYRLPKPRPGDMTSEPVIRAGPPQILVLSDGPGAGKSMLALELTHHQDLCQVVLRTPGPGLGETLEGVVENLGEDRGLRLLLDADTPLVYVVDGLEKANHAQDHREIKGVFKLLDSLNEAAREADLLAFPLVLLFTLRDSDWDRWFTLFEGRNFVAFRRQMTIFTPDERRAALDRYQASYQFDLVGELGADAEALFDVPVNVRFLAETLQYQGEARVHDVFQRPLMERFLRHKSESVLQRLPDLTSDELLEALAALASTVVLSPELRAPTEAAIQALTEGGTMSPDDAKDALRSLVIEKVLMDDGEAIRFHYPSLLEYLVAADQVVRIQQSGRVDTLEDLTVRVAATSLMSSASVRSNVEKLVKQLDEPRLRAVEEHYATSPAYMRQRFTQMRAQLGEGRPTSDNNLASIYDGLERLTEPDAWDAFFVVVARPNRQPQSRIVETFRVAWDRNHTRGDRWKLLSKMAARDLLHADDVVDRVRASNRPREWETFLGLVLQRPERDVVRERWAGLRPDDMMDGPEWAQVRGLFAVLLEGRRYVEGTVY
jgi:hypothetical protein